MMDRRESSTEIDAAASDWAVRIDHAPLAPGTDAEFQAWLTADIRRRGAFARAQATLLHARRAKALGTDFDPDAYRAAHEHNIERAIDPVDSDMTAEPDRRRFLRWGASAAVVTAAVTLTGWFGLEGNAKAYETKRGEIRLVPLQDGSQMTLNTATSAKVRFSDHERRVMLEGGEALFDVAHDAQRPFVVVVNDMTIRALGTSFTVRHLPGQSVQILVKEGTVELQPHAGIAGGTRIAANNRAVALSDATIRVSEVQPAEVGRALVWREGMLSFEDATLADAAAEFARYSDRPILFAEPALARETVTGLYSANNPGGFARAAALSLGLRVQETSEGIQFRR